MTLLDLKAPALATRRRPVRPLAVLAAAGSGAALLLAFPPYSLWWLAPVGVALLAVAVRRRGFWAGAGLGLLAGLVCFVPLLGWAAVHVSIGPWLLLSVLQALFLALLGGASAYLEPVVVRSGRWGAMVWPLATAVVWVAQEALRSRAPFGGFPWGRLAFSQGDAPLLRLAAVGGAPLVTFAVALAGGLLAVILWLPWTVRTEWTHPAVPAGWCALAAVAVVALGYAVPTFSPGGAVVTVAVVQGNVPRMGLDFNSQRRAVLDNHVNATIALAQRVAAGSAPRPDLVVWPENSSDIDPLRNRDAAARIDQAARAVGVPILVGAVLAGPTAGQARNVGIVWDPVAGPGQIYDKRHPVPFAEYMPWRPVLAPIAGLIAKEAALIRSDFAAGTEPGVLAVGPARLGVVICFEVAYDSIVRDTVHSGAGILVVQTNNATFDEAEALQQMAMVRLRAVEHGRDALMASTVGVSGFVTADGEVHDATGFNEPAVIVGQLRVGSGRTLATRLGPAPEIILTLGVLVLIALRLRRRDERDASAARDATV